MAEIRESNAAMRGFTKQYTMDGSEGIDAMSFLNDVQSRESPIFYRAIVRQRLT